IAMLLGKTVYVGGHLHNLTVAADGSSLELVPFDGPTGTLNLESKMDSKGKLLSALVVSEDGQQCFDLAGASAGLALPTGTYHLHRGRLGLGNATVQIDGTDMKPMVVEAGSSQQVAWGSPVRAEFDYQREGSQITFQPDQVWLTGAAGERYLGWSPIGKSPEFSIVERNLGTEIEKALFPGSC
ncbi:MAG TPA: hypothetical protein P5218_07025, partial [Planctomycetota bacterium]|nr:hypothetical protein [Planctomycetota bacterium]